MSTFFFLTIVNATILIFKIHTPFCKVCFCCTIFSILYLDFFLQLICGYLILHMESSPYMYFSNLFLDLVLAYPLNTLFQKIGFYKLKKFNSTIIFVISYSLALLNYGFQKFIEKPKYPELSKRTV